MDVGYLTQQNQNDFSKVDNSNLNQLSYNMDKQNTKQGQRRPISASVAITRPQEHNLSKSDQNERAETTLSIDQPLSKDFQSTTLKSTFHGDSKTNFSHKQVSLPSTAYPTVTKGGNVYNSVSHFLAAQNQVTGSPSNIPFSETELMLNHLEQQREQIEQQIYALKQQRDQSYNAIELTQSYLENSKRNEQSHKIGKFGNGSSFTEMR